MFEVRTSTGELFHTSEPPYDVDNVRDFIDWIDGHSVRCGSAWFIALRDSYENEVYANVLQIVSVKQWR